MGDWKQRTRLLLGNEALTRLEQARVAVFGLGGVGGHCLDALVRAGIGSFLLVDMDVVDETNLNRQLLATTATIGRAKVEVARERIMQINPGARIETFHGCFHREVFSTLFPPFPDFVVDAIDTLGPKADLLELCLAADVPTISVAGAGRRLDPTRLMLTDLASTQGDPLARRLRRELRSRGLGEELYRFPVVASSELPLPGVSPDAQAVETAAGTRAPFGSISTVPAAAGLAAASHVIRALIS